MVGLLKKAATRLSPGQLRVNPDCGLTTRGRGETRAATENLVVAARAMRAAIRIEAAR